MTIAPDPTRTAGSANSLAHDLLGRSAVLTSLTTLLTTGQQEVVTLTGIGGIGKSTLARTLFTSLESAFPATRIWITPTDATDPDVLRRDIGYALGSDGSDADTTAHIREAATSGASLLVIDGADAPAIGPALTALIAEWPALTVIVTSRMPLQITDERIIPLEPLAIPSAVELFLQRWDALPPSPLRLPPDPSVVDQICRSLDGIPLAIELAAGWGRTFNAEEIRDHIATRLDRLVDTRRRSDRDQRTMHDVIRWSYERLEPAQQQFLSRLSPFVGGFALDLATRMAQGRTAGNPYPYGDGYNVPYHAAKHTGRNFPLEPWDGPTLRTVGLDPLPIDPVQELANLLDLGLIHRLESAGSNSRFRLLDPVREFLLATLSDTGDAIAVFHSFSASICALFEAGVEGFYYAERTDIPRTRLERSLPNFRAALTWLLAQGDAGTELAQRLAGFSWIFWQQNGRIAEGRTWMDLAFSDRRDTWPVAACLPALGFLTWIQGDDHAAEPILRHSIDLAAEYGLAASEGSAWLYLALVAWRKDPPDFTTMIANLGRAVDLLRPVEERPGLGVCCQLYGVVAQLNGDSERALAYQNEALEIFTACGFEWGIASAMLYSGTLMVMTPDAPRDTLATGIERLAEAYGRYSEMGDLWGIGGSTAMFGAIALQTGRTEPGGHLIGAAMSALQRGKSFLPPIYDDVVTQASDGLIAAVGTNSATTLLNHGATWTASERDDAIGALLMDLMSEPAEPEPAAPAPPTGPVRLTNHQLEIVRLLAEGLKPPQVAQRLNRHPSSVYEAIDRIQARLGVNKWEQIVPTAQSNNLL